MLSTLLAIALLHRVVPVTPGASVSVVSSLAASDPGDNPAIALPAKLGVREGVLHFDIEPKHAESDT